MPCCLFSGAEDCYGVDVCAAVEDYGGGESGAEGCEFFGGKERVGTSVGCEESEGATRRGGLGGG